MIWSIAHHGGVTIRGRMRETAPDGEGTLARQGTYYEVREMEWSEESTR
jgi:hypothetical protein